MFLFSSLSALFLLGLLIYCNFYTAIGDTFDIVTSLETPCPGEFSGIPCLTLQQYVSNPSSSTGNVTLLFETGNHTLGSAFSASSAVKYSLSGDNVNIECISSIAQLNFQSIQEVYISGINFWRCHGGISLTNIVIVIITNSTVQYSDGGYSTSTHPIILLHVGECFIYDSIFSHNRNRGNGGLMRVSNSSVSIDNSIFQNNYIRYSSGGMIYATSVYEWPPHNRFTNITIINSIFMDNVQRYYRNHYGGVIYVYNSRSNRYSSVIGLTIQNCTFINNNASSSGGVIHYRGSQEVTVINSTFLNNAVSHGRSQVYGSQGGAIYSTSPITVIQCNFISNRVQQQGRAIYRTPQGGAIYSTYPITVIQCNFISNRAQQQGRAIYRTSQGGAIYSTSPITVIQCNFISNRAQQQGGAIYSTAYVKCVGSSFTHNSAVDGGAIFSRSDTFTSNCSFNYNTATNYGGGIHITGTNSSLTVHQSSFTNNRASTLGGGAIYSYSNVTISESIFSYNSASYCSVLDVDEFYHFYVSITDSVFTYNMATGRLVGGGVACIRNASISILRSSFQHNQAALHGGVFHIDESDVLVDESVFVNNSASGDGGVFYTYVHLSHYDIRRSEFSYNSAGDDGGVMFIGRVNSRVNSRVNISECVFSFNNASDRGGVAALIGSSMFLELNKTSIFNNTAEYGGVISACNGVVIVMEDALFTSPDPVYSFCTLYDGHIVHYHISPPVDPELTPSPSATQQTRSPSFEMISRTRPQDHLITSAIDFSTTNTISNSTSKLYPTQLSSVISKTEQNEATSHSDMVISRTFSQSPIMVTPSKINFLTTTAETGSSNSVMRSSEYVTMAISVVFSMATVVIIIVLAGMIIKLYKMKPTNKQPTTSRHREKENPLFECERTEREMKDNDF